MTIVVTVKVTDGIALAADSAASFVDAEGRTVKIYNNANKVFNLVKSWPIGAMASKSAWSRRWSFAREARSNPAGSF